MDDFMALILAAGKGTRMKSDLPKVLHKLKGRPMLEYVLDLADEIGFSKKVVVTGEGHEIVEELVGNRAGCVFQREQLGTGHAVLQAWDCFADFTGNIVVIYGDTSLLTVEMVEGFLRKFSESNAHVSILTAILDDPGQYGRIIRRGDSVVSIVEAKDATQEERKVKEINTGICCFKADVLRRYLPCLKKNNVQGELYLTDVTGMAVKDGLNVTAFCTQDWQSALGINTLEDLAFAESILEKRK